MEMVEIRGELGLEEFPEPLGLQVGDVCFRFVPDIRVMTQLKKINEIDRIAS